MKHVSYSNIVCVCVFVCVNLLCSCRPETVCRTSMEVGLVCEYRHPYVDENKQDKIATVWDSITVVGIGNTDTLYNNVKNTSRLLLPMHTDKDSTSYTLRFHDLTDTIHVRHTNQLEVVSLECGCVVEHDVVNVIHTDHWIDSIEVVADTMRRTGETNILIWMED